MICCNFAF